MTDEVDAVQDVEGVLLRNLTIWSAGSIIGGGALYAVGRAKGAEAVAAFGRQNAAWGVVDGVIAGAALASRRRRGEPNPPAKLLAALRFNSVLNVGYVVSGAGLMLLRDRVVRLQRIPGYTREAALGDGAAIIVQGGYLLVADAVALRRLFGEISDGASSIADGSAVGVPLGAETSAEH